VQCGHRLAAAGIDDAHHGQSFIAGAAAAKRCPHCTSNLSGALSGGSTASLDDPFEELFAPEYLVLKKINAPSR